MLLLSACVNVSLLYNPIHRGTAWLLLAEQRLQRASVNHRIMAQVGVAGVGDLVYDWRVGRA